MDPAARDTLRRNTSSIMKIYIIFRLVDMLRAEGKLISGLKKLNIEGNDLNRIVKLNINPDNVEKYLLDFRDPSVIVSRAVTCLNDDLFIPKYLTLLTGLEY